MTKLPSDSLKAPRRPWRAVAIVAGALLVIGGGSIGAAALTQEPTEEVAAVELSGGQGKPTEPQISHKLLVPHVLKSTTPPPPPPPPPAPENYYGNEGPVQCPSGTVAGAVDGYGNESACYETNNQGQQCVAYDANNNCTQYYKP